MVDEDIMHLCASLFGSDVFDSSKRAKDYTNIVHFMTLDLESDDESDEEYEQHAPKAERRYLKGASALAFVRFTEDAYFYLLDLLEQFKSKD